MTKKNQKSWRDISWALNYSKFWLVEISKFYDRSYIDVVLKPLNKNFVDEDDIKIDDENVTNDQQPYHDDLVEYTPAPLKPSFEP